ncbi:hypothetical protein HN51_035325 [Arachis hypogaea]|nr:uncharacterized protein DS421_13g405840 [Arachis hypogaea]
MLAMETLSAFPFPHTFFDSDEFAPLPEKCHHDLTFNFKVNHDAEKLKEQEQDFSFPCFDSLKETFVTAEEIFDNGQIKPIFPVLHQSHMITAKNGNVISSPLRRFPTRNCNVISSPLGISPERFFVEQHCNVLPLASKSQGAPKPIICELSKKMTNLEVEVVEESKKRRNKKSSISFLNLWRLRRHLKRQNFNDGKDGLICPASTNKKTKAKGRREKKRVSAHEQFYVMNRLKKESNKRRSFLPYKLQLCGLFASLNIFSGNLLSYSQS